MTVFDAYPGLDAVLHAYRDVVCKAKLAGPTSFAPAIYKALELVEASGGQYHILLIIADGQVRASTGSFV